MAQPVLKGVFSLGLLFWILNTFLFGQSLGELAKQQRARAQRRSAVSKVYTNDDVKSEEPEAPPTKEVEEKKPEGEEAAPTDAKGQPTSKTTAKDADKKSTPAPVAKTSQETEISYRDQFAKLRDALSFEQKKLDVMQRELNLTQTQYYSDPNVALREQTFRTQINQRTEDIKQQQVAVENATKAISDLEEELRVKGLPSGWTR